ncbi:MAG: hypothetical protein HUK08_07770 [Bacteroidaceae bacterium]|nr:hypothetical protein [Bacteroidaceae bacterium]
MGGFMDRMKAMVSSGDESPKGHAIDMLTEALDVLNCKWQKEKNGNSGNEVIYFKYQGMNFRIFTLDKERKYDCNIDYHAGVWPFSDLDALRRAVNSANSSVLPVHFYYIPEPKDNVYNVYETATICRIDCLQNLSEELGDILEIMFSSQHTLNDAINKTRKESQDEEEQFMSHHEIWMAREMELTLQEEQEKTVKDYRDSAITLTDFLEDAYGIQSIEIDSIGITVGENFRQIKDTVAIHSFILLSPIISGLEDEGKAEIVAKNATLTVCYVSRNGDKRHVTVMMKVENDMEKAVYVRVTTMREGDCISLDNLWGSKNNMPRTASFLMAIDKDTKSKRAAEVKYMWEEMQRKNERGEQLNDDELYLSQIASMPHLGNSAYWGRKRFNEGRFHEALMYFENINEYIESNFFDANFSEELREFFARNCFYMSVCHCELGRYELGVYYAEKACVIYSSPLHQITLIKAMYRANDFRLIAEIRRNMEEMESRMDETKDDDILRDTHTDIYEFLQKALALSFIRYGKWDDAKQRLEIIIKEASEEAAVWAKEQLAKINLSKQTSDQS